MIINGKEIRDKAYIIVEIAGNFSSLEEAKKLIDGAIYAGVDAVKLQTYKADTLASVKARYEMENTGNVSQYEIFKEGELSEEEHFEIYKYANKKNIDIFSTPSHIDDIALLKKLGTNVYKIGSDDAYNLPFIEEVAKLNKPIMVATGMRTIYEVDEIVDTIMKTGNKNFMIFHAITSYPTTYELANLNVIKTMLDRYPNIIIGYSDHTVGWQCSYAARVMGAMVIERHFTLDREAEGPDHILSSTPEEMKILVDAIKIFEEAQGDGIKMPVGQELKNRKNNAKSIILAKDIKKHEMLSKSHLSIKRPGYGIEPKKIYDLIGKQVNRDLEKDSILSWDDIGE
ncbi:MAG TPA: N-acylneuraminate-9-phosphate synthase [Campylobacterales bacterium]|nr:N-acylneuraminate-9-phosphate synthase [Campylobacterales bacterium]